MNRVKRLLVLFLTFAGGMVPGWGADPSSLQVQLMIFSGRPDPTFIINDPTTIRELSSIFAGLPPHPTLTEKDSAAPGRLGYRGFRVTPTGMDGVAWFDVYGNVIEIAGIAVAGGVQAKTFRFDKDAALEQLLVRVGRVQGLVPVGEPPTVPANAGDPVVERRVTISVGAPSFSAAAMPVRAPVTVRSGTRVHLVATQAGENATDVIWVRDSREVAGARGRTLEIASASAADSGLYWAVVGTGGGGSTASAQVELLVTNRAGQRLLNLSTLSRIGAEQRVLVSGFTIEPGAVNSRTLVLVRAVGPGLASFGVAGPLRVPELRVLDASGAAVAPANVPFALPTVAVATERVGAFALAANSADAAFLYFLPAGAFTAHVSSADGGAGAVLLEIFEVPLE